MKIFLVCSNYEPGGAQRALLKLNQEIIKRKISVSCIFFYKKGEYFSDDRPLILSKNNKINPLELFKIFLQLARLYRKEKPDVVISFLPGANIVSSFLAFLFGIKYRIISHRNVSNFELSRLIKLFDYLFAFCGIYTHITAVSESTKNSFHYYSKKDFDRILVIPNGVEFKEISISKNEARDILNIPQDEYILGAIGRLVKQKNHQFLINLLPKLPKCRLIIVGKGNLKKELEELAERNGIAKQLTIIDELNTESISIFFKSIDLFLMPSQFEGLSNALIEALAAGLPILASDIDSQRDVLHRKSDNFLAGTLLRLDYPELWINSISELMKNPSMTRDLTFKAKLRAKDFSIDKMADGFLSIIS